jgi:Trk K+ transport system NAD-binding subunit
LERRRGRPLVDELDNADAPLDVIVCGAGRLGGALLDPLRDAGHRVLAVDFDPRVVESARAAGHTAVYGDVEDPELPASLPLTTARWVVCTVRRTDVGLGLLHALEHHGLRGGVVLTAHDARDAAQLRARGAHHVLRPYEAAAAEAVAQLTSAAGDVAPRSSAMGPGDLCVAQLDA